jgi:predicted AlkP superfamily pyrophosphatase or phosphodiesterase
MRSSVFVISLGFLCLIGGLPVLAHEGHDSHKVVMILFDGFRWDYLKINGLEGFSYFMKNGAWVEKMTMAFPTLSYPQYYTIMTGE